MKTTRKLLSEAGFDWKAGRIFFQETAFPVPGNATREYVNGTRELSKDDPILDLELKRVSPLYGGPLPRIVAFDSTRVFFPKHFPSYDVFASVWISPEAYLADPKLLTPFF